MACEKCERRKKRSLTARFNCLTRINSIRLSTKASISAIRNVYISFCKETTLHGLKHTVAENLHWFERWLWFVMTVLAFMGAVFCGLTQLSRYNSEPVVVSMQRDYRGWWTTFPAITACFMDRVQVDKARNAIEYIWNVTEESDPEKYQYYYSFIELVSDVSFRTNLQNFWKYQTDDSVKDVDLLQLALDVHPTFPLKVMVSKESKEVQWVPVMTEMGICMTFNSEYAMYQLVLDGVEWGVESLLKCHYHSGTCYVRVDTLNNAVRYFVHSPYDIPTTISNPTGEVSPGLELVIDFKSVQIQASSGVKKLRLDQRRCRNPEEWITDSIRMALCATLTAWRVSGATSKYSLTCLKTLQNAPVFLSVPSSITILTPKRSLFASLGGTTALFVGASVLTVVETALFVIRHLVTLVTTIPRFSKKSYIRTNRITKIN